MNLFFAATALLVGSASAQAGQADQAAQPQRPAQATAAEEGRNRLVCRRVTESGSRVAQRRCLTAEQWEVRDSGDQVPDARAR